MEYVGFQHSSRGYALLIADGHELYGGVPEPVTRTIPASDLNPDNIKTSGSGKARFTRLRKDYPPEHVGHIQARIRAGAKELKSRSIKATLGSLAIAGGARVVGDLLLPVAGGELVEKTIKACEWVASNSGDASLICAGTATVGGATEHATRFIRVIKFQFNGCLSGKPVSIACAMPTHHFRAMLKEIQK